MTALPMLRPWLKTGPVSIGTSTADNAVAKSSNDPFIYCRKDARQVWQAKPQTCQTIRGLIGSIRATQHAACSFGVLCDLRSYPAARITSSWTERTGPQASPLTGAVIMFGFGSRQKLQMAQMALQEALMQLENTIRERDAYLQQRDIAIGERNLALAEIERLKRQAQNPV